jgi:hypothetical protein
MVEANQLALFASVKVPSRVPALLVRAACDLRGKNSHRIIGLNSKA